MPEAQLAISLTFLLSDVSIHAPVRGTTRILYYTHHPENVSIHAHMAQISATQKQRDGARYAVPLLLMPFYPLLPRWGLTSRSCEVMRQCRTVRLANLAAFWRAVTVPHAPYLFAAHFTPTR